MTWDSHRINHARKMHEGGFSASAIGRSLGVTKGAVLGKLYRLGLSEKGKNPHWSDKRRAKFIRLWMASTPIPEIMREMSMSSAQNVYIRASRLDLPNRRILANRP